MADDEGGGSTGVVRRSISKGFGHVGWTNDENGREMEIAFRERKA